MQLHEIIASEWSHLHHSDMKSLPLGDHILFQWYDTVLFLLQNEWRVIWTVLHK